MLRPKIRKLKVWKTEPCLWEKKILRIKSGLTKKLENKIIELSEKLDENISHSHRINLFYNLPDNRGEITSEIVNDFFIKDLKVPAESVDKFVYHDMHRLGLTDSNQDSPVLIRKKDKSGKNTFGSIIVAFTQQAERNMVLSHE